MSYHRSDSRWTRQRQTRVDFNNLLSECTATRDPLPVTSEAEIGLTDSENIYVLPLVNIDTFNELQQSPDNVVPAMDVDSHNGYQTRVCMNTENSTSLVCNKEIESHFVAAYHEHSFEYSEQDSIEMNTNEEVMYTVMMIKMANILIHHVMIVVHQSVMTMTFYLMKFQSGLFNSIYRILQSDNY